MPAGNATPDRGIDRPADLRLLRRRAHLETASQAEYAGSIPVIGSHNGGTGGFGDGVGVGATAMKKSSQIQSVGAGLQVMQALIEADVTTLAGPKGKHSMTRTAVRHGGECGSVTPWRAADAADPPACAGRTDILGKMAMMEKMLAGLSTRRYRLASNRSAQVSPKHPLPQAGRRFPAGLWR